MGQVRLEDNGPRLGSILANKVFRVWKREKLDNARQKCSDANDIYKQDCMIKNDKKHKLKIQHLA